MDKPRYTYYTYHTVPVRNLRVGDEVADGKDWHPPAHDVVHYTRAGSTRVYGLETLIIALETDKRVRVRRPIKVILKPERLSR